MGGGGGTQIGAIPNIHYKLVQVCFCNHQYNIIIVPPPSNPPLQVVQDPPCHDYYYRDEWELYDLVHDPQEVSNLVDVPSYQSVFLELKEKLLTWQKATNDPWVCAPDGVYVWENRGRYPASGVCLSLDNGT